MTDVDLLEHKAGPAPDEPPYGRRCRRCGYQWPCPERKRQLAAEAEEMKEARVSDDARRVGVLALVEVGVQCWSSTRTDAGGEALGGVVVEINDVPDPETGEISRYFTCLNPYGGGPVKVRRLAEAEIIATGVESTANSRLTNLIKRLAGEVHDLKGSYLDVRHADRIRWMGTLASLTNLAN